MVSLKCIAVPFIFLAILTSSCSGQSQNDPCAAVVEPSIDSLLPGSKHEAISAIDPDYKGALTALVRARTDVMKAETTMLESVGRGLYAQRSSAELARTKALIDSGLLADFRLIELGIEKVCLDVGAYRLDRIATDSELRRSETARLTQASKVLRAEAVLSEEQLRQKYLQQTDSILAQAKQPAKALADLKSKLATLTASQDKLKTR